MSAWKAENYASMVNRSKLSPNSSSRHCKVGSNVPYNEAELATASDAAVIRPNVDALYSRVGVDLSQSDLVITVPPISDGRFHLFPFYDM